MPLGMRELIDKWKIIVKEGLVPLQYVIPDFTPLYDDRVLDSEAFSIAASLSSIYLHPPAMPSEEQENIMSFIDEKIRNGVIPTPDDYRNGNNVITDESSRDVIWGSIAGYSIALSNIDRFEESLLFILLKSEDRIDKLPVFMKRCDYEFCLENKCKHCGAYLQFIGNIPGIFILLGGRWVGYGNVCPDYRCNAGPFNSPDDIIFPLYEGWRCQYCGDPFDENFNKIDIKEMLVVPLEYEKARKLYCIPESRGCGNYVELSRENCPVCEKRASRAVMHAWERRFVSPEYLDDAVANAHNTQRVDLILDAQEKEIVNKLIKCLNEPGVLKSIRKYLERKCNECGLESLIITYLFNWSPIYGGLDPLSNGLLDVTSLNDDEIKNLVRFILDPSLKGGRGFLLKPSDAEVALLIFTNFNRINGLGFTNIVRMNHREMYEALKWAKLKLKKAIFVRHIIIDSYKRGIRHFARLRNWHSVLLAYIALWGYTTPNLRKLQVVIHGGPGVLSALSNFQVRRAYETLASHHLRNRSEIDETAGEIARCLNDNRQMIINYGFGNIEFRRDIVGSASNPGEIVHDILDELFAYLP